MRACLCVPACMGAGRHADREKLAAVQHEIWSHWMEYLFNESFHNDDGSVTIPPDKVTRWAEQMKTDYSLLTERERESDRHQADKVLEAIKSELAKRRI